MTTGLFPIKLFAGLTLLILVLSGLLGLFGHHVGADGRCLGLIDNPLIDCPIVMIPVSNLSHHLETYRFLSLFLVTLSLLFLFLPLWSWLQFDDPSKKAGFVWSLVFKNLFQSKFKERRWLARLLTSPTK